MITLRLALRELRGDARFAAFFALNLALGLCGFVAQDAFQASVSHELRARSQAWFAGDVVVSSRRPLAEDEVAGLDALAGATSAHAQSVELFSMAAVAGRARLVEVQAIDAGFPLYGEIVLASGVAGAPEHEALRAQRGLWGDPALLHALGLEVGSELALGAARFRVQGEIARDGGRPASGFSLAPRAYVALEHLAETGLVQTGSRIEYRRFYRLAQGEPAEIARAMREQITDPQLEVRSHEEATSELSRVYAQVGRALGLVSLSAAFLAGVGSAQLFRAFLLRRMTEVAILLALGATRRRAERVYVVLLALLGVAAGVLACALGALLLLPLLARLAQGLVPQGASLRVGWPVLAQVACLAAAGGVAASLPVLAGLRALRPAQLFAEAPRPELPRARTRLAWLPAAVLFAAICLWRAPTLGTGVWFAALFALSLALLTGVGRALLRGLGALPNPTSLPLRHALRELARGRGAALAGFVALALCVLLQGIAPQLRGSLTRDLEAPDAGSLPSLFLFDIQPEQRDAVAAHVTERGAQLTRVSPLVRARLTSLDGQPIAAPAAGEAPPARARMARDAEADARRLRTRSYNLTYPVAGGRDEQLVAGRPFSGARAAGSNAPAEISLEREFADRLGVGVGAALGFDVQGVPVEGRIVNLREVRWQSFEPNFFVEFQAGVLEEAPQTFLAAVPALPDAEREALQASLADAFPNVSSVDVTRAVARLLALAGRLEWALAGTASLSLWVGLASIYAIARDQSRARRTEINLQKVLGAEFRRIRAALDWEYGLLGLLAALAGSTLCLVACALLARFVLEVRWTPSPLPLAVGALGVPLLCIGAARLAARRVLRERPLVLLQGR